MLLVQQTYSYNGARQAEELIADSSALFVDCGLSEQDKGAVMRTVQGAYWIAKRRGE